MATTRELHPSGAKGDPSARLFAAGPSTKGEAWEIIAVPDLRMQAASLADHPAAIPSANRDNPSPLRDRSFTNIPVPAVIFQVGRLRAANRTFVLFSYTPIYPAQAVQPQRLFHYINTCSG